MRAFLRAAFDLLAVTLAAYWLMAFIERASAQTGLDGKVLEYPVEVIRVIDGDTVEGRIQLGFNLTLVQHIRIYGIDTPELHGPERERALRAKAFTEQWVADCAAPLTLVVYKQRGKYGRIVGDLKCLEMSLSHDLWQAGLARRVDW